MGYLRLCHIFEHTLHGNLIDAWLFLRTTKTIPLLYLLRLSVLRCICLILFTVDVYTPGLRFTLVDSIEDSLVDLICC